MSLKNNNVVKGILIPLHLHCEVCAVLSIIADNKKDDALEAMRHGITKDYKSATIHAWRSAQRLYNLMRECDFMAYVGAPYRYGVEEHMVLTEYAYVSGVESVRSFVGNMKQCRQKMAKWYHKRMREVNKQGRDICNYVEYDHAIVQDNKSGSFRYEFWIKDSCN